MVFEELKGAYFDAYLWQTMWNHAKQARKPRSYASLKLWPTYSLTGVKCRATSVAKNLMKHLTPECISKSLKPHFQTQSDLSWMASVWYSYLWLIVDISCFSAWHFLWWYLDHLPTICFNEQSILWWPFHSVNYWNYSLFHNSYRGVKILFMIWSGHKNILKIILVWNIAKNISLYNIIYHYNVHAFSVS